MSFKIYFILFMLYSIFGWICEEIVTFDPKKGFINRGFLLGPYCPIYGFSAIFMTILLNKFSNSLAIFSLALIICSTVEYLSSYVMEKLFNARWWDYSKKPFNINGRICLLYTLVFALFATILYYFVIPKIIDVLKKVNYKTLSVISIILLSLYLVDNIYSTKKPNVVRGAHIVRKN